MQKYHVAVAAEAFAAALFARCGLDVSVQYGANQPEYDLIVTRGDKIMKVSVKGSKTSRWGLTQSQLAETSKLDKVKRGKPDYHGAIDLWLKEHGRHTVFCLVQFHKVPLNELPRVYLATPAELAAHMKKAAKGRGYTKLYEEKHWTSRAYAAGTTERIPPEWRFSPERAESLLESVG